MKGTSYCDYVKVTFSYIRVHHCFHCILFLLPLQRQHINGKKELDSS